MVNLEWLEKMKKEDERYYKQESDINKYKNEYRIMKALEIIAEELIDTNRLLRTYIIKKYIINNGIK